MQYTYICRAPNGTRQLEALPLYIRQPETHEMAFALDASTQYSSCHTRKVLRQGAKWVIVLF
jgi:hypothetical protein